MSRLDYVHAIRPVLPKCGRRARLTVGCCISAEHGDIAAEADCVQNACSRDRSAYRPLEV